MRRLFASDAREVVGRQRFPADRPGTIIWWRRGDSTFRDFRSGLDYAFIRSSAERVDAERVIRLIESARILVLAPGAVPSANL